MSMMIVRDLILILLNQDLSFFENSVEPDQMAFLRKPSDQDPHCFPLLVTACLYLECCGTQCRLTG